MHTKELKQMEDILLVRKKALLLEVEERLKKYKDANNEKITDVAEIASSVSNEELEILIAEEDARELKQIEEALVRIGAGHYGICEQCGKQIKKARLKAIPFTTLCVSCKEEEEKEYGEKSQQVNYTWETTLGNSENGDMEEFDKKYLGKKIADIEYLDENKN